MPGRTWVIAPDEKSLQARWRALQAETNNAKKELLFHPQMREGKVASRHLNKAVKDDLGHYPTRIVTVGDDAGPMVEAIRYAFRTFDRQWLPADSRLLNDPRPQLWKAYSGKQFYLTAPSDRTPTNGPALSICGLVPDLHHYHGRGGRVFPLWRDAAATVSNIPPPLLASLSTLLGRAVAPDDVMAYLAAVLANPAYTARFAKDLVRPGLRVPMTADAGLFARAVALGREVVWLHTYGERFADAKAGRPAGAPRLAKADAPSIPKGGTIPGAPEPLPETMDYDPAQRRLIIGKGYVDNVAPAVSDYEVSGMNVLRQWFSYRKRDRSRPSIGDRRPPSPLSKIQPDYWPHEYTTDLLDLLHVLGRVVALEPQQAALLDDILAGPLLERGDLGLAAAAATVASAATGDDPAGP